MNINDSGDPDWFVSNRYGERGFNLTNPDLEVSVYIEEYEEIPEWSDVERTMYSVGLHDTTIAAHPTIPSSLHEETSWTRALCRAFDLIQHVHAHIYLMRTSDDYQRAIEVQERAPPTREESDDGVIPGFEVRNREGAVYGGRMSVEEAVGELYEEVLPKHEERAEQREAESQ